MINMTKEKKKSSILLLGGAALLGAALLNRNNQGNIGVAPPSPLPGTPVPLVNTAIVRFDDTQVVGSLGSGYSNASLTGFIGSYDSSTCGAIRTTAPATQVRMLIHVWDFDFAMGDQINWAPAVITFGGPVVIALPAGLQGPQAEFFEKFIDTGWTTIPAPIPAGSHITIIRSWNYMIDEHRIVGYVEVQLR